MALFIRVPGITWGLPNELHNQSYHPDEQVIWVFSQGIEPAHLKFTPGVYNYGTLYLTLLRVASDVVAGYGGGPKANDPESVWRYIGACHLAGRWISALAGSGAVVFVFFMLRRLTNEFGAALGAMLLAVAAAFVVHSRFQTVDVLATFFLAGSLWFALRVLDDERPDKMALLAGVFAGLSAGTKYTGVLALLALVAALALRDKPFRWKALASGVGACFGVFLLTTPGALLESDKFLRDFRYEMLHTSTGHGLVFEDVGNGFLYHLTNLFQSLGPIALIMAVVGLGMAAWQRQRWAGVLLAFFVPYYFLIGRAEVLFIRYTFPLLVVLAVAFGWLAGSSHDKGGKNRLVAALAVLATGLTLIITLGFTSPMMGSDYRDILAKDLKANAKPETTVGLVSDPWFYTPPLIPDSAIMRGQNKLQWQEMAESSGPHVVQYIPEDPRTRFDWDKRLLTEIKPDFVVFSSFEVADVSRLSKSGKHYPEVDHFLEFQAELEKGYQQVSGADGYRTAGYMVHDLKYVRPIYWVWKRKP